MQMHILAILKHPYDMHSQHVEKHRDRIHLNELESLPFPEGCCVQVGLK